MGFLQLLGHKPARKPSAAPASQPWSHSKMQSRSQETSQQALRKEVVRVALRDALLRNGIPDHLLQVESVRGETPDGAPASYIRLRVLEWDHRLMAHAMAFQQELEKRILTLDRTAGNWLLGVTWQLCLAEGSYRPALPPAEVWNAGQQPAAGRGAGVISGPTRIATTRADLERMLDENEDDSARRRRPEPAAGFQETQPMPVL